MSNKLDTVIDAMHIGINEEIISDLVSNRGYTLEEATKLVAEFADFNLSVSAAENPVTE